MPAALAIAPGIVALGACTTCPCTVSTSNPDAHQAAGLRDTSPRAQSTCLSFLHSPVHLPRSRTSSAHLFAQACMVFVCLRPPCWPSAAAAHCCTCASGLKPTPPLPSMGCCTEASMQHCPAAQLPVQSLNPSVGCSGVQVLQIFAHAPASGCTAKATYWSVPAGRWSTV